MRVLLLCAAFPPQGKGGGPIGSALIARGLAGLRHEVRVVTVADDETFTSSDDLEVKTIRPLNIYWNYWRPNPAYKKVVWHSLENFNPRSLVRMRREIRAYDPDIVVTISVENINVATWMAARLEGKPVAHLIQSPFLMCWKGSMTRNGRNCPKQCADCRVFSMGKKALSRYVDGATAETRFMLDLHLEKGYFPNALSRVIPGAVDFPDSATGHRCDDHDPLRVGYIGVHTVDKGLGTLSEAAHGLAQRGATVRFYIAGDEPSKSTERWRDRFPPSNTRFFGWMRPEKFFQKIDLLVVPSIFLEAFGRVSVEAMRCGVPVICSRAGGLSENVREGKNGLTIAPGDHVDLMNKISILAADRNRLARMGDYAAQYADRFRLDAVASAFTDFLSDVRDATERRRLTGSPVRRVLPVMRPGARGLVRSAQPSVIRRAGAPSKDKN